MFLTMMLLSFSLPLPKVIFFNYLFPFYSTFQGTRNKDTACGPHEHVMGQMSIKDGKGKGRTGSCNPTPIWTTKSTDGMGRLRGFLAAQSQEVRCLPEHHQESRTRQKGAAHHPWPTPMADLSGQVSAAGVARGRLWGQCPRVTVHLVFSVLFRKEPWLASVL